MNGFASQYIESILKASFWANIEKMQIGFSVSQEMNDWKAEKNDVSFYKKKIDYIILINYDERLCTRIRTVATNDKRIDPSITILDQMEQTVQGS